ncbi:c-type cytochrome [Inhella proteolytica]|uniref:C-type cytochrome n=1 Tax=Inhella proteolytica TaxID=2795029 RepID=A0A931J322_9BURK|nr:c-type cytochrome [Inhella proteolytica]MBH9575422.1 c-type cytochrome [Inhella proteolytica]
MKTILRSVLLAAAGMMTANAAMADLALAQKKNCMACHAVDKKVVGPSYKDVAAKYAKDKKAADMLAEKIIKGGKGAWGEVPMPPNQVTADEAKKLATWILTTK